MENELNGLNGSNANNILLHQNNRTSLPVGPLEEINNPNNQEPPPIPKKPEGLPINEDDNKSKSSKSETLKFIGTQIKAGGKSVGAKIGHFLKGAVLGMVGAAFFVASKPSELGQFKLGVLDSANTLKGQIEDIDDFVKVGTEKEDKANILASRAGGALGGVVGAAIGTGLSVFTGLYALLKGAGKGAVMAGKSISQSKGVAAIAKNISTFKENRKQAKAESKERDIGKLINMQNKKGWSSKTVFIDKKLLSAMGEFVKGDKDKQKELEFFKDFMSVKNLIKETDDFNTTSNNKAVRKFQEKWKSLPDNFKKKDKESEPKLEEYALRFIESFKEKYSIPGIQGECDFSMVNLEDKESLDKAKEFIKTNVKNLDENNNNVLHNIMKDVRSLSVYKQLVSDLDPKDLKRLESEKNTDGKRPENVMNDVLKDAFLTNNLASLFSSEKYEDLEKSNLPDSKIDLPFEDDTNEVKKESPLLSRVSVSSANKMDGLKFFSKEIKIEEQDHKILNAVLLPSEEEKTEKSMPQKISTPKKEK